MLTSMKEKGNPTHKNTDLEDCGEPSRRNTDIPHCCATHSMSWRLCGPVDSIVVQRAADKISVSFVGLNANYNQ